jgi:hypothetical protein
MVEQTAEGVIAGTLVTETLEYDGGRKVKVYVPPDPPDALVFASDGQLTSPWAGALEAAPRTVHDDRRCPLPVIEISRKPAQK